MLKTNRHITPFCILTTPTDTGETPVPTSAPSTTFPKTNTPKTTQDWQVATLRIQIPTTDFKIQTNIPKMIFWRQKIRPKSHSSQPVKQHMLLQPTTGKFIILTVLPVPHPQLLIIIPLFIKSQQQLRSKADAEVVT